MRKKRILCAFFCVVFVSSVFFSSCKTTIVDALSTALSGTNKKGKAKRKAKKNSINPMLAITSETDIKLVSDFFPTALELYEIIRTANPNHLGISYMTGSLNVMYANAFIQSPAESLGPMEFDKQLEEFNRAKMHYLRGRDYCLKMLNGRHKGFSDAVFSGETEQIQKAVEKLDKHDLNAIYWAAAGWLGAFSLDPLNADLLGSIRAPSIMLERLCVLNPDYNKGAAWELLCNFYVSAPQDFGGNYERGMFCYEEAIRVSGGKTPGPYILYAEAICVPEGNEAGFVAALEKALSINPDDDIESRLMTTISQDKARRLLAKKSDYFLEW
ncbi:MAG: TRAP transporter TatT component family protein [Treponema sp.]|nr:TRAP transporter TatT component family protein [Treponema sp.]